jgi:hypothetical protein
MNPRLICLLIVIVWTAPLAAQATTSNTLVILGEYTINGSVFPLNCARSEVQNIMFSDPDGFSVRQAFLEASYGKFVLNGDVLGPYRVSADELASGPTLRCGSFPALSEKLKDIAAREVDLGRYDRLVYVLPLPAGCNSSTGAVLGDTDIIGRKHWIFDCANEVTYEHEIGHQLLNNARHSDDLADPMNYQIRTLRLFNPVGSMTLGWMPAETLANVTADGTYLVAPMELDPATTLLPQVYRLTTAMNTYYLSYRQPIGVDRRMGSNQRGLRVNYSDPNRNLRSVVAPGQTAIIDGVRITNQSQSPGNLAFCVNACSGSPPPPDPTCAAGPNTLCLQNDRFTVSASWRNGSSTGPAASIRFSNDTGYFWFFSPENTELAVKILNADDDRYWLFFGGLTDLEYTITVTDTKRNLTESYRSPSGNLCGGADADIGLAGSRIGGGTPPEVTFGSGSPQSCTPDLDTLCLYPTPSGGQPQVPIKVELTWKTASGSQGIGRGERLSNSTQAGYFTFFSATNVELLTKVLDARTVNNRFWIFTGALSDVEYTMTFTNTASGRWVRLLNPLGNYCGSALTGLLY